MFGKKMRPLKIVTSFSLSLSLPLFPFLLRRRRPEKGPRGRTTTTKTAKEEEKMAAPRRPRGPPLGVSSGERRRTAKKKKKKKKKDIKVEWSDHLLGVLEVQKSNFGFAKSALCFLSSLFF